MCHTLLISIRLHSVNQNISEKTKVRYKLYKASAPHEENLTLTRVFPTEANVDVSLMAHKRQYYSFILSLRFL